MDNPTHSPERGVIALLPVIIQWLIFGVLLVIALRFSNDIPKFRVSGSPQGLIIASWIVLVVLVLAYFPPVYVKFPRWAKMLIFVAFVAGLSLFDETIDLTQVAWRRSPEAVQLAKAQAVQAAIDVKRAAEDEKQAAVQAAADAERDALQAKMEQAAESAAKLEATLKEEQDKLEGCFTFRHRLPALEDPVRESMHNPDAFGHVQTALIEPDFDHNNVAITFRAENGFGALRTATVKAKLSSEDCSVTNIGEPELD